MKNVQKDCPFCYKNFSNETLRKHIGIIHLGLSIQDFVPAQTEEKKNPGEVSIASISLEVTIKQENPSLSPEPKKTKERELRIVLKRLPSKDIEKPTEAESSDPLPESKLVLKKLGQYDFFKSRTGTYYYKDMKTRNTRNCSLCKTSFKDRYKLRNHLEQVHNKVRKTCNICFKEVSYGSLKRHIKSVHEKAKIFCQFCSRPFAYGNEISLKRHIETIHEGKRFNCEVCSKKLSSSFSLRNHTKSIHEKGTKMFACTLCDKCYPTRRNLLRHCRSAHEGRVFKCTFCSQSYMERCRLQQHMRKKHGNSNILT